MHDDAIRGSSPRAADLPRGRRRGPRSGSSTSTCPPPGPTPSCGGRTPADPLPADPDWSGGTVLERRPGRRGRRRSRRPVRRRSLGIGGERGWLAGDWLWRIRGVDGPARRRRGHAPRSTPPRPPAGRRPARLLAGRGPRARPPPAAAGRDAPARRGVARVDGRAHRRRAARLEQRALFHPRGLYGRAYWLAVSPFHRVIFRPWPDRLVWIAAAGGHPRDAAPTRERRRRGPATRSGRRDDRGRRVVGHDLGQRGVDVGAPVLVDLASLAWVKMANSPGQHGVGDQRRRPPRARPDRASRAGSRTTRPSWPSGTPEKRALSPRLVVTRPGHSTDTPMPCGCSRRASASLSP